MAHGTSHDADTMLGDPPEEVLDAIFELLRHARECSNPPPLDIGTLALVNDWISYPLFDPVILPKHWSTRVAELCLDTLVVSTHTLAGGLVLLCLFEPDTAHEVVGALSSIL